MVGDIFSMVGKTVVFTGGCGMLGRVMVKALLEYGANVVVPSKTDRFDQAFDMYRIDGKLKFVEADLSDSESTRAAFEQAEKIFGKINVLVNCVAYGGGAGGKSCEYRLDEITDEVWENSIDGTLNVVFRCTREVIPYFDRIGGGCIVNIGSMYGMVAPNFEVYGDDIPWNPPPYGAGKAGVLQFTRYCASALARRNIRVNSITPGTFPDVSVADKGFVARLSEKVMLKRTGKPEELNGALLLLCSDASSFMTGTNIVVDGGATQW